MIKIGDYNAIMNDRNIFNQIVYTPLSEALRLLDERRKDPVLMAKVEKLLGDGVPNFFNNGKKCAVLFRQVATPNYETNRFVALAKENGLHPVIFEYQEDLFSPDNNQFKYSLGKLHINKGTHKKGGIEMVEKISIVDFNEHKGHKINDIKTLWSELLVDFHKFLFLEHFKDEPITVWNGSGWFKSKGAHARDYYKHIFLLFVCHGIFFENFLTSKDAEGDFSHNIVLPAIEEVVNLTGVKPLVVPIEPLDMELDEYWVYHGFNVKELIKDRKKVKSKCTT